MELMKFADMNTCLLLREVRSSGPSPLHLKLPISICKGYLLSVYGTVNQQHTCHSSREIQH